MNKWLYMSTASSLPVMLFSQKSQFDHNCALHNPAVCTDGMRQCYCLTKTQDNTIDNRKQLVHTGKGCKECLQGTAVVSYP